MALAATIPPGDNRSVRMGLFDRHLQDRLLQVRSQLSREVEDYFRRLVAKVDVLPELPKELQQEGLSLVHQRVRVLPRLPSKEEREQLEAADWEGRLTTDPADDAESSDGMGPIVWDETTARRYPRVILLGRPGFGKSVLCKFDALTLAGGQAERLAKLQLAVSDVEVPLLVQLPLLRAGLRKPGCTVFEALLEKCEGMLGGEEKPGASEAFRKLVLERLETGSAVVWFDGWDEIPKPERGQDFRKQLQDFVAAYPRARIRMTSRSVTYEPEPGFVLRRHRPKDVKPERAVRVAPEEQRADTNDRSAEAGAFDMLELWQFSEEDVQGLAGKWFPPERAEDRERFLAQLKGNARLDELSRQPLLCALLCGVALDSPGVALPGIESEVYRLTVALLLKRAENRRPGLFGSDGEWRSWVLRALSAVSLETLEQGSAASTFTGDQLTNCTVKDLQAGGAAEFEARSIATELARPLLGAGLLVETAAGSEQYKLLHRTVLEYLAACMLAGHPGSRDPMNAQAMVDANDRLFDSVRDEVRIASQAWDRVVSFIPGIHLCGVDYGRGEAGLRLQALRRWVELLMRRDLDQHESRCYGLGARALAEIVMAFPTDEEIQGLKKELAEQLVRVYEHRCPAGSIQCVGWPMRDRVFALEQLGYLGDPRFDRDLWVRVEGGRFTPSSDGSGRVPRPVWLSPFYVAWCPVTVEQFMEFVENGYALDESNPHDPNRQYWTNAKGDLERDDDDGRAPHEWDLQVRRAPTVPVTGVSWHAARAFCRWARKHWKRSLPRCPRSSCICCGEPCAVSLPTDAQWEFVARGADLRRYPWGNQEVGTAADDARANLYDIEDSPRKVTPVGAFPGGHRTDGSAVVVDLSGNVMEWCLDFWRNPPDQDTVKPDHVTRGSSWSNDARYLSAENRNGVRPRFWLESQGFRLVCRCPREHVR